MVPHLHQFLQKILVAVDQHTNISIFAWAVALVLSLPNEHGSVVLIVSPGAYLVSKLTSLHVSDCACALCCILLVSENCFRNLCPSALYFN